MTAEKRSAGELRAALVMERAALQSARDEARERALAVNEKERELGLREDQVPRLCYAPHHPHCH